MLILEKSQKQEVSVSNESDVSSDTELFDLVELLDHFDGDKEFAQSILAEALLEIPQDVEQLFDLCKGGDLQAIRHLAHTIKGMAANLCTNALRDIAFKIETAAKDGQIESIRELLPNLERTAQMTSEAINLMN